MRIGENPEKNKNNNNVLKPHRIIVVFYIPDSSNNFYQDLDKVLDVCLNSIIKTINHQTTNITLINNNSSNKLDLIIEKHKNHIDKYVYYKQNKGKVYAVLNEARAVYEPFVTITDADILFYNGWEEAVFSVFKNFPQAGSVAPMPMPYLSFAQNNSVFGFNSALNKISYNKFVNDYDIELYIKGTNLPKIIEKKGKYNWKQKQFILKNKNNSAIIGCYHVVATYRTEIFKDENTFPSKVFINSYEELFIDNLSDKKGFYKLSTTKSFAYHIGNKIDEIVENITFDETNIINESFFNSIKKAKTYNFLFLKLNSILGRIFLKYKWKK